MFNKQRRSIYILFLVIDLLKQIVNKNKKRPVSYIHITVRQLKEINLIWKSTTFEIELKCIIPWSINDQLKFNHIIVNVNWSILTLFSTMAGESSPNKSLRAASLKSGMPATGRYSWFSVTSVAICASTVRTTGNTHGFPSSVL